MNWIGRTIEQFRIEEQIGVGTNGRLFSARHLSEQTFAAIRIIDALPGQNGEDVQRRAFEDRFASLAPLQQQLMHEHIVRAYAYGLHEGEALYVVTDLMDGGSLENLTAEANPLPIALCIDVALQTARALQYGHARQIVHGGLKPNNILRRRRGSREEAREGLKIRLSDFQMVRLSSGNWGGGALAYMSPEQCQGLEIDARSDLYSLGIVLYQILTNLLPFQPTDRAEAAAKHMHQEPPPPRSNRTDLSSRLEQIVLRCLAKHPDDRFDSADDLVSALEDERQTLPDYEWPLNAPDSDKWSPPPIPPLEGDMRVPRIQVLNADGVRQQVVSIERPRISVGRVNSCDIVLDSRSVSREHLELRWEGGRITLLDTDSANGTLLEGKRLRPRQPLVWSPAQPIRIGPFWLCLSLPPVVEKIVPPPPTPAPARFTLTLDKPTLELTPDIPQTVCIIIGNQGPTVEHLTLTVEGLPIHGWFQWPSKMPKEVVPLNPGDTQRVNLVVNVPKKPENHARVYPVRIRAASRDHGGEVILAAAQWKVLGFTAGKLTLDPHKASGRTSAAYVASIRNEGNTPSNYSLRIFDDEKALTCDLDREMYNVPAGQTLDIPFSVHAKKRWFGNPQSRRFTVTAKARGAASENTTHGEFEHRAVFPPWVLQCIIIGLALLVAVVIFLVHQKGVADKQAHDAAIQRHNDAIAAGIAAKKTDAVNRATTHLTNAKETAAGAASAASAAASAASSDQATAKDAVNMAVAAVQKADTDFTFPGQVTADACRAAQNDVDTATQDWPNAQDEIKAEKKDVTDLQGAENKLTKANRQRDAAADHFSSIDNGVPPVAEPPAPVTPDMLDQQIQKLNAEIQRQTKQMADVEPKYKKFDVELSAMKKELAQQPPANLPTTQKP